MDAKRAIHFSGVVDRDLPHLGELHGVANQVGNDAGHLDAVRVQPDLASGKVALQFQALALRLREDSVDLFPDEVAEREIRKAQIKDACLEPG